MNILVFNLSPKTTVSELRDLFSNMGTVNIVQITKDNSSLGSGIIGFVEMANNTEAYSAIVQLNGIILDGYEIIVKKGPHLGKKGQERIHLQDLIRKTLPKSF